MGVIPAMWQMPPELEPYRSFISDAGVSVEQTMNDYKQASSDFLMKPAGRALSVHVQVGLLLALKAAKLLKSEPGELPPVEEVAAKVHEAWMKEKLMLGIVIRKAENGENLMVPYEQLSDRGKELDRAAVRAVYAALQPARLDKDK